MRYRARITIFNLYIYFLAVGYCVVILRLNGLVIRFKYDFRK